MRINFPLYICAAVLLWAMPAFTAEPVVDFDGRNPKQKDVKAFLAENDPGLIPGAVKNKAVPELIVKHEILSDAGEWIELKPVRSWLGENGEHKNQYSILPGWATRWTLRCPKAGKWTAKKSYQLRPDQLGGHYHYDAPPPLLSVSSISLSASTAPFHSAPSPIIFPEMKGNTTYYYWMWFPSVSTKITIQLDAAGVCQVNGQTDYFNIEVPGLSEMPYGENYILDNSQDSLGYHPDAHYGSQKLLDVLMNAANEYATAFPNSERLRIMDMSLPWGGMFDLDYDWKEPHYGHTLGSDADISRAAVPSENRQKLLEIMCGLTPGIFLERNIAGEPLHYHMRVYGNAGFRSDDFPGNMERALSCCKGNAVDPANLQLCLYARN